jgi:hypothetical protein
VSTDDRSAEVESDGKGPPEIPREVRFTLPSAYTSLFAFIWSRRWRRGSSQPSTSLFILVISGFIAITMKTSTHCGTR